MEPLFLALDEVLEIHAQQIELYGGSDGVRDPAGLESAVATPMATFGGQFLHPTIPSMAAAYLFHICQNHSFVDGNKRTAANAAITFLLINDWELDVGEDELVDLVLARGVEQYVQVSPHGILRDALPPRIRPATRLARLPFRPPTFAGNPSCHAWHSPLNCGRRRQRASVLRATRTAGNKRASGCPAEP